MFYNTVNEKAIQTLCPTVQAKARAWLAECSKQGVWVKITCGYRGWAGQAWDYAQGRYRPGSIITYAKPGYSFHGYRVALDFVPADGEGNLHWEDIVRFRQAAMIAKNLGFTWGGDWIKFRDVPHLQFTNGHNLAYFQVGGKI